MILLSYAVVKIKLLASRSIKPTMRQLQARKKQISTIRTMSVVSGTYVFTFFPSAIVRLYILNSKITWFDLESRTDLSATILFRVACCIFFTTTPVVNPLIYLTSRKHLSMRCRRLLGFHSDGAHQILLVSVTVIDVRLCNSAV